MEISNKDIERSEVKGKVNFQENQKTIILK